MRFATDPIAPGRASSLKRPSRIVPMVLWIAASILLAVALTRPVILISVNISGALQDVLDRQKIVGLMLQEKGVNLPALVSRLPPDDELRQSIVSSVHKLMQLKCYTAATLILVFSIFVPIVKQLAYLLVLLLPPGVGRRLSAALSAVHKWAMLDVFVLAMVVLTLSTATAWNAKLLDGFFYFLAYFFTAGILGIVVAGRLKSASPPLHSAAAPPAEPVAGK